MLKEIRNYILEKDFQINYINKKLNIVNHTAIDHFDDNLIILKYVDGILKIKGNNLIISKLQKDELLISGNIKTVEFG